MFSTLPGETRPLKRFLAFAQSRHTYFRFCKIADSTQVIERSPALTYAFLSRLQGVGSRVGYLHPQEARLCTEVAKGIQTIQE